MGAPDEIDLHGQTWREAREEFIRIYNAAASARRPARLKVIHGWGSSGAPSVIRPALRGLLDRYGVRYERASFLENKDGHTIVYPGARLPVAEDRLQTDILAYCDPPKTKSEISGKFRRHGQPAIDAAMRSLLGAKLLSPITDNGRKKFGAS